MRLCSSADSWSQRGSPRCALDRHVYRDELKVGSIPWKLESRSSIHEKKRICASKKFSYHETTPTSFELDCCWWLKGLVFSDSSISSFFWEGMFMFNGKSFFYFLLCQLSSSSKFLTICLDYTTLELAWEGGKIGGWSAVHTEGNKVPFSCHFYFMFSKNHCPQENLNFFDHVFTTWLFYI